MFLFSILLFTFLAVVFSENYNGYAWKSASSYPTAKDFPEYELLQDKPNVGISFSGGGSRAYTASIGYLAGLHKLDLIKNVKYISGISGGSWATSTFTFAQNQSDDTILLGDILNPENFSLEALNQMDSTCARALGQTPLTLVALNALKNGEVSSVPEAWAYGVSKTYLEPVGVQPNTFFTWNQDTAKDITSRNPSISLSQFVYPVNKNRPYPILGTVLAGPMASAPYNYDTHNFTMVDITPLYVGQFASHVVQYYQNGKTLRVSKKQVGGAVEPFIFSRKGSAPKTGLTSTKQLLSVPKPEISLDLQFSAGASSYAPGSLVESINIEKIYDLGMHFDYWSPVSSSPSAEDTLFADGGSFQNMYIGGLLQRGVKKIALFDLNSKGMQPSSKYNPSTDPYTGVEFPFDIANLFGIYAEDDPNWKKNSFENRNNQFFSSDLYPSVVQNLQKAQEEGKGIFYKTKLTTIENTWWGVPAGIEVEVLFAILGRLSKWESSLPENMKSYFIPSENADDLSVTVSSGPFRHFPHYPTIGGTVDHQKANALADLTGWSILQNKELFNEFLS